MVLSCRPSKSRPESWQGQSQSIVSRPHRLTATYSAAIERGQSMVTALPRFPNKFHLPVVQPAKGQDHLLRVSICCVSSISTESVHWNKPPTSQFLVILQKWAHASMTRVMEGQDAAMSNEAIEQITHLPCRPTYVALMPIRPHSISRTPDKIDLLRLVRLVLESTSYEFFRTALESTS